MTKDFWGGLALGAIIATVLTITGAARAQVKFDVNPLFTPVDTYEVVNEKDGTVKEYPVDGISDRERDMTVLYGRLDYMVTQIERVIETCAK